MLRTLFSRQLRGSEGESRARKHLESVGLRFRAANVRYRFGEIDLVMDDGDTLVFVEVRVRLHAHFGGAANSVDQRKQRRLFAAASAYLATNPALALRSCRFDIIAIEGPTDSQMHWLRNAFTADDLGRGAWG